MKEFIEKLIGRLEEKDDDCGCGKIFVYEAISIVNQVAEEQEECFNLCSENCEVYDKEKHYCPKWCKVIRETVEELKEEYFKNAMIDGQYCFQTCGATEHCKECNRLGNGSIDYYENYDVLAEEHNNDFCEWKIGEYGDSWKPNCCDDVYYLLGVRKFEFCPYCGKKIKVAPYQPKGE